MRRSGVALLATATLACGGAAGAQTELCHLIVDPAGDPEMLRGLRPPVLFPSPAIDILSADIEADATDLTVVVRVQDFDTRPVDGLRYRFQFAAGGVEFMFQVMRSPQGDSEDFSYREYVLDPDGTVHWSRQHELATPRVLFDPVADELRMSVPVSVTDQVVPFTSGLQVSPFYLTATRAASSVVLYESSDDVRSSAQYTVGTPTCVQPVP